MAAALPASQAVVLGALRGSVRIGKAGPGAVDDDVCLLILLLCPGAVGVGRTVGPGAEGPGAVGPGAVSRQGAEERDGAQAGALSGTVAWAGGSSGVLFRLEVPVAVALWLLLLLLLLLLMVLLLLLLLLLLQSAVHLPVSSELLLQLLHC